MEIKNMKIVLNRWNKLYFFLLYMIYDLAAMNQFDFDIDIQKWNDMHDFTECDNRDLYPHAFLP